MIAASVLEDMNTRHDKRVTGLSTELMDRLNRYDWPGNVRELRNTIERAVILASEGDLGVEHLPQGFGHAPAPSLSQAAGAGQQQSVVLAVGTTVDEGEKQLILRTLQSTGGNKTRAADVLQISLKTLHNKLKEYAEVDGVEAESI